MGTHITFQLLAHISYHCLLLLRLFVNDDMPPRMPCCSTPTPSPARQCLVFTGNASLFRHSSLLTVEVIKQSHHAYRPAAADARHELKVAIVAKRRPGQRSPELRPPGEALWTFHRVTRSFFTILTIIEYADARP